MPTTADFVRWRLEGPKHWPSNSDGYTYVGVYNEEGHELFVNSADEMILCNDPQNLNGAQHDIASMFNHAGNKDWDEVRNLYEAYQKCRQSLTS